MDRDGREKLLYRCDGTKCAEDTGMPLCFYTSDPAHALKAFSPKVIRGEPTDEQLAEWEKETRELAEWQTFMPVEERMACKRGLPVFPDDVAVRPEGDDADAGVQA